MTDSSSARPGEKARTLRLSYRGASGGRAVLAVALLWVVAASAAGVLRGAALSILVLAAATLFASIGIVWASIRALLGESTLEAADAFALASSGDEVERKQAVLRALKDLEFERSVGKIDDEDYARLVAQYRAEAKLLLKRIDEKAAPRRKRAEKEALRALDARSKNAPPPPSEQSGSEAEIDIAQAQSARGLSCPKCGTRNDDDAAFCKRCGQSQGHPVVTDEGAP